MRIGYLECFAGISGDMLLGALIDAGVSVDLLQQTAKALNIGAELHVHHVDRSGIRSTKVDVLEMGKLAEGADPHHEHDHEHNHENAHAEAHSHSHSHEDGDDHAAAGHTHGETHAHSHSHAEAHTHGHEHTHDHSHTHEHHDHTHGRTWKQIRELIQHAALPEDARALALTTFELLAQAEAKIHGMAVEDVHFHEVGSVDTITDIVCSSVGLCSLGVERWHASDINVGSGFVECAHGTFPVPAPATAELLQGMPTYAAGPKKELVTPTGAALLRALNCIFGDAPKLTSDAIGYGAGTRNPERFPNVLRLTLGESKNTGRISQTRTDTVTVLECAVDDASPQILAHALELAIENGALDVMAAPVTMKKGRLGTLLTVLAKPEDAAALEELLFRETTTLGIRRRNEQRSILERTFVTVETAYGKIRVKVASAASFERNAMPEYEDCRRAAREHAVPLKAVTEAALIAFHVAKEKTTA
jgi:pyridinium-3,5-bisthiocarboxylic acid mononucleotide nickel chelatase